jgi:hypothetical protein
MSCGRRRVPEQEEYPSFNKREVCTEEQSHLSTNKGYSPLLLKPVYLNQQTTTTTTGQI